MAAPTTSLFAGFDLEDVESLRHLQPGLQTCYRGGDDLSSSGEKYTAEEEATIRAIVQRMNKSPLLHKIFRLFIWYLNNDAPSLLAVGKQLLEFATVDAEDPALPQYKAALQAWDSRAEKLSPVFSDDEDSNASESIINYNHPMYKGHPLHMYNYNANPEGGSAVIKTEIPDSEEDEEDVFYDSDGNELEGETIVVDVSEEDEA